MSRPFNKIVGKEYDNLVKTMIECGEDGNLPQCLQLKNTAGIDIQDVHDLLRWFTEDTGLQMKFQAEVCPDCGELHAFIFVDYPEPENTLLQ